MNVLPQPADGVNIRVLPVPKRYREVPSDDYLPHQKGELIEDYARRILGSRRPGSGRGGEWAYLPVAWTAFENRQRRIPHWVKKYFGWNSWTFRLFNSRVQAAVARAERCFTVCQHDLGIHINKHVRAPDNLLIFSSGGVGDVPLPLLCDPRSHPEVERDLLASFKGVIDHPRNVYPWRAAMRAALRGRAGVVVVDSAEPEAAAHDYVGLIARSRYSLCPRGFGRTSFRLSEAMHLGSVPVYIHAGDPWVPYLDELDWSEFCLFCDYRKLDGLEERLRGIPEERWRRMSARAREVAAGWFTPVAAMAYIDRFLAAAGELGVGEIRRRSEHLRRPLDIVRDI
jgi:hypothetical protein